MVWMNDPHAWIALATLTALEIVLGIDNIIFISILVERVEKAKRNKARIIGLSLAMITRICLLLSLTWVMGLTDHLFTLYGLDISGRDLIMISGGLFLIWKSTHEIHASVEGDRAVTAVKGKKAFGAVLIQIALIDIVFSLDSVITAVGMASHIQVMIAAVVISVGVMMISAKAIGGFVEANPTIKILALSFLIMVGVALIGEGFEFHIPKGYIYFSMAFSIGVEILNMKMRKKRKRMVDF
ncbi:MAG: TerC family protein [Proteobacteria bacterium]|nr:TerC family protein [Pseudomonadota bacterium]MBU1581592.1 TerC family protein [Pseudomonadota bacterium]MBU2455273.1 TerC family protein [Pseudomonadota bacterium]MBU2631109.1 TerC family protein [Pseudomonadota bacterium]